MPPTLDVLIIDEAHHLKNTDTLSHRACRAASEVPDAALALTATPIHLGSRDLNNLLSLLDPEEFSSFDMFEACMSFNQKIVEAERLVARSDPDRFQRIHNILHGLVSRSTAVPQFSFTASASELVVERLRTHPLFADTLDRLRLADPQDGRETIEIQLAELNFLSRPFTKA
jgi:hypothetical protein